MGDDRPLEDDVARAQSDEPPAAENEEDDEWVVDDPSIPNDAMALRRLTESGQVVYDDVLECNVISISLYSYRADGMSVYVSSAMRSEGITDDDLMPYCAHGLARVPAHVIRREGEGKAYVRGDLTTTVAPGEEKETPGGLVLSEAMDGPTDIRIRRSHGLVRIRERPVARRLWTAFRHKLIQASEYRPPDTDAWVSASGAA